MHEGNIKARTLAFEAICITMLSNQGKTSDKTVPSTKLRAYAECATFSLSLARIGVLTNQFKTFFTCSTVLWIQSAEVNFCWHRTCPQYFNSVEYLDS